MSLNIDRRRKRRTLIAAVCVTLAAISISEIHTPLTGYAASDTQSVEVQSEELLASSTAATGRVTGNNVNVRSGAGTSYATIGVKVNQGQSVTILGQQSTNGTVWYNVRFTLDGCEYIGWIISTYVEVIDDTSGSVDEEYVQYLKNLGFPDSYCTALAKLHAKYPEWEFVPVMTGLDWQTVVEQESKAGVNLVQSTVNDARKSTESFAYDWSKNKWYGFDGADWVCASSEFIAYCMDPRNYLDETYIFQFETLEYASYQTKEGVSSILSNTFMSGNYTDTDNKKKSYAETFVTVGSELGVSPYHLAARCKQEQGTKGTSQLISGTYSGYEGYYNYFNVGAYTTTSADKIVNGLIYAKKMEWNTIYKSIAGGSEVVANNYIKKGQNTVYFEKFNVVNSSTLYSHQYMTNVMAAISEGSSAGSAYTDKNQAFVFRIPVYENMPETAVTFTDTGNPNNWLSSLKVSGQSLTPSFSASKTAYTIVVDSGVTTINVSATAVASTSTVSGTGKYSLEYGDNTIKVSCVSESGSSRTYTITVARQYPASGTEITVGEGTICSSEFVIGDCVTGIAPGSSASDVLSQIAAENCTVKILGADGAENTDQIATGNKLAVYDTSGSLIGQYDIVIYGDINGDGKVSNVDLVLMQKHILGISTLEGSYLEAADASKGGGVSNKDLVLLQKHILGIESIEQ